MTRHPPRIILCLCLSLLMALAGVQGALVCGQAQPVTSLVICGHDGAETIWLDARGQPTGDSSHDHCPKCLGISTIGWAGPPVIPAFAPSHFTRLALVVAAPLSPSDPAQLFQARGPPPAVRTRIF